MPANPQDTTYGSDADLLEERGHMWKARAEAAEAEVADLKRTVELTARGMLDGAQKATAAAVLREREECAALVGEGRWAPTHPNGCCRECGRWTPARHSERHDHSPSCSWSSREFYSDPTIAAAIRARSK